jgi:hypothetical protein
MIVSLLKPSTSASRGTVSGLGDNVVIDGAAPECTDGLQDGREEGTTVGVTEGRTLSGSSVGLFVSPGLVGREEMGLNEGREVGLDDVGVDVGAFTYDTFDDIIVAERKVDSEFCPGPSSI